MDKTVHKWFWVWEFEKEEAWLADMAAQGWALEAVRFGTYRFVACKPGQYAVRLELLDNLPRFGGADYTDFLESTGAKYLGNIFRWAYFRKDVTDGPFELFSDLPSRIRHLDRMVSLVLPLTLLNALMALLNLTRPFTPSRIIGGLCMALSVLLLYGVGRIVRMRRRLRREQLLRE